MADEDDQPIHEKVEESSRNYFDEKARELYKGDDTQLKDDIGKLYEPPAQNDDEDEEEDS